MKAKPERGSSFTDSNTLDTSVASAGEYEESEPAQPLSQFVRSRSLLLIAALFWLYVTLSNLMYARSLQANMAQFTPALVTSPWGERGIQHLLLFPALVLCYWVSLRAGWRPYLRSIAQLSLGVGFASLSYFAMNGAEFLYHAAFGLSAPTSRDGNDESHGQAAIFVTYFTTFFLTYGFGLGLVTGFALYRRFHASQLRIAALRREWSAARLSALRMQLSPHTLFNLLHTIRGQINWHPEIAREMVAQLADLLRRLLSAGQRDFVLLTDELHFVGLYLELQRQRFSDRLTVVLPHPGDQPVVWLPSLITQPLVENAVAHGLAGHDGPVTIRVETLLSADVLTVRIINTIDKDRVQEQQGIGISNVRERLRVQFGSRAQLAVGPTAPTQWVAQLQIPALREMTPRHHLPQPARA